MIKNDKEVSFICELTVTEKENLRRMEQETIINQEKLTTSYLISIFYASQTFC
jgi:hypothetical protein